MTTHLHSPEWESMTLDGSKPHQKYLTADGTAVPGVTTVLGKLNKPALIDWAWKLGKEGIDYRTVRDSAASVGSCAHFLCETWLKQKNAAFIDYDQTFIDRAIPAFNKFCDFWESNGFKLIASEAQLVSETYRYGGTIDIVALDQQGRHSLIDIKTSKGIYPEMVTQVAAYRHLWNETTEEDDANIARQMIVRIGKDGGDQIDIKEIGDQAIEVHFNRFLGALTVYKADVELKQYA